MSKPNGSSSIGDKGVAVDRQLPCELTEAELLLRGESMAEAELQIDKLKADRRATNKQILEQVDARNKLAHTIESGEEMRVVQCRWNAIESQKLWRLMRTDTNEQIEERPMTAADLQGALTFPSDDVPTLGGGDSVNDNDDAEEGASKLQRDIKAAAAKLPRKAAKKAAAKGGAKVKTKAKGKSGNRAHA